MPVRIKRVYQPHESTDGIRVLVDRLWPRGVPKRLIHLWLPDIAPSTALRKWFNHDPEKWPRFLRRYRRELQLHSALLADLRARARGNTLTLLFASRNLTHNNAVALRLLLKPAPPSRKKLSKPAPTARKKR